MRRVLSFLLACLICFYSVFSQAAAATYSGYSGVPAIVNGTPGKVATVSLDAVVDATVLDQVVVATKAGSVTVPVSTTAAVDAAAIGTAASRMVPYVALALTAAQVAVALKNAGFRYGSCAHPGLIVGPATSYCKPDPTTAVVWRGAGGQFTYSTPDSACQSLPDFGSGSQYSFTRVVVSPDGLSGVCMGSNSNGESAVANTVSQPNANPGFTSASADDIAGALKLKIISDSNARKAMYDAIKSDLASNPGLQNSDTNPVQQTTPISVSAPPVTGPVSSPSIQTIQNPDGTTSTQSSTQQTTVTPTTTGTTVADSQTTFPSKTTTVITTTNNTTNQTTTTTNVSNNPTPTEFPDDYNREVTQKQIEKDLNTDAAPQPPDLSTVPTQIASAQQDDSTDFTNIPTQLPGDKSNWFSWVWTPPVGSCVPSTATLSGVAVSLDYCPTVLKIRDVMGFLFALYGAWQIYSLIFKE